jgi:hypothetical protein
MTRFDIDWQEIGMGLLALAMLTPLWVLAWVELP